jgi:hypothetical protein
VGFPSTGVFHGNRLYAGGTKLQPNFIWGSKAGDFFAFSPTGDIGLDATDGTLDDSVNEDNAISYPLRAPGVNGISWMFSSNRLVVATNAAVWSGGAAGTRQLARSNESSATVVSPADFRMDRDTQLGAVKRDPIEVGERVAYISSNGTRIYSIGFQLDEDSFTGLDMTLFADHMGRPGFVTVSYALEPWSTANVVRSDGQLAQLTEIRDQDVRGWGRWVLGGSWVAAYDLSFTNANVDISDDTIEIVSHGLRTGDRIRMKVIDANVLPAGVEDNIAYYVRRISVDKLALYMTARLARLDEERIDITTVGSGTILAGQATDAVVEDSCVIPATLGDPSGSTRENIGHDQTWVVVKRTVNGETTRSIEFFEEAFREGEPLEQYFGVDSGLTYSGPAVTSIAAPGLIHLAGERVDVLADGVEHLGLTVASDGSLELPDGAEAAALWHIGYGFDADFKSLRLSVPNRPDLDTKLGRVDHVVLRLLSTLGLEVGSDEESLESIGERLLDPYELVDEIPELFSGDKEVAVDAAWRTAQTYFIRQSRPLPCTLLAVAVEATKSARGDRSD